MQFLRVLREGGATVRVASTLRNATRAYLMHTSWGVARPSVRPSDVPPREGVDIRWDHGNDKASMRAAREMVNLFRVAHRQPLTSNHIRGKAIDMSIR